MPFYEVSVTSPANTPASAPTEGALQLAPSVITHVAVQIPRGCVGLVHSQIWRADFQLWPSNPGGDISGDGAIIEWDEEYVMDDEPLTLRLIVWNEDDTYPHTITFRFTTMPLAVAAERGAVPGLIRRIGQFLGGGP